MKKNYTIKTFIVLLVMAAMNMSAQLSGLYTINSGAPVSSTNYTSVSSFANDLNIMGVAGPVTVNIAPNSGPYNGQITFNVISGASAINNIVVEGNGNTVTWSSSNPASAWTILLNGTDYLTVKNLTVNATGSNAFACILVGGADNNAFTNVRFSVPANTTSSNHIPVVFSGSSANYFTASNSGNNNVFTDCTLFSGYFSLVHYGLTGSPYNSNNQFINCKLTDWYYYGVYSYYAKNLTVSGCTIDRPTHNGVGFGYGMYLYYNHGFMANANKIRNFWGGSPGNTNGSYPIYIYYNPLSGTGAQQNRIQNNIISDMNNNSYIYGIYSYYQNGFVEHNTIAIDNPQNNYTGTFYGCYLYSGGASYPLTFRNNIVVLTAGGTNAYRYCYYAPTTSGFTSNYNDLVVPTTGSFNYVAYYNGNQATIANLQTAGSDANSVSMNPLFLSPATYNYLPGSYPLNNLGLNVGITTDNNSATRATVPDMGALEFLDTPCTGSPASSTVVVPFGIQCPGTQVGLSLSNSYTTSGITIQWQSSTVSNVGPWTAITGGTNQSVQSPTMSSSTYYSALITCTNSNGSSQVVAGQVQIAGTTTNSVPYYENFDAIGTAGKLPNCSWYSPNLGGSLTTYTSSLTQGRIPNSGTSFASFYYSPSGSNIVYTNGIYLNAGVTYSAGVSYKTEYYGYTNWSDMSLLLGTGQNTTGLVTIASSNGPAVAPGYKLLSNTFSVATSGLYYLAIRANSTGGCCAYYMNFDDVFINVPCQLNPGSISVAASQTQVCVGQPVTITASGASTYAWSNGATTAAITVSPNANTTYMVSGTNPLTGCVFTANQMITVNPAPLVGIFVANPSVCKGSSVQMSAFGAQSYNWNNGGNTPNITVSPSASTSYTVVGINSFGCQSSAVQLITVNNLPTIVTAISGNQICLGETAMFSATGGAGNNYVWNSNSSTISGSMVVVSPNVSTSYVVTGTDANGCSNTATVNLSVSACTGVSEITTASGVKVYPNPSKGEFSVVFNNEDAKTVDVMDVTGRLVANMNGTESTLNFNLGTLANGVYYVRIQSNNTTEVVKLIKE